MALCFILLVAFIFAGLFTIAGVIGWKLVKPSLATTQKKTATQSAQTVQPAPHTSRRTPQPPQPVQPVQPGRELPTQPHARFEMGLTQCLSRRAEDYPCAWQDTQQGVLKQFKIEKYGDPMVRRVFDKGGKLLHTTAFNVQHNYIIMRQEHDTTWFFDKEGLVRQIETVLPDHSKNYYYYTANGQLNSCLCADRTTTCCPSAPRVAGQNRYCRLFALDEEFCPGN